MKTKLTLSDILVSVAVLLVAFLPLLFSLLWRDASAAVRIVSEHGEEIYSLGADREVTVLSNEHTLVIEISNGGVRVKQSDCDDGICMASGEIRHNGEVIVCAPAGVRIEPTGDEVDYVVG